MVLVQAAMMSVGSSPLLQFWRDGIEYLSGMFEDPAMTLEFSAKAREHVALAGMQDRITIVEGPAAASLAKFEGPFDLAFIDADKPGYATYFELVLERMRPGGLVVFDNSLYSGAVLDPTDDANTQAIMAVNDLVAADDRVETVLVNVGDGLLMARKR